MPPTQVGARWTCDTHKAAATAAREAQCDRIGPAPRRGAAGTLSPPTGPRKPLNRAQDASVWAARAGRRVNHFRGYIKGSA